MDGPCLSIPSPAGGHGVGVVFAFAYCEHCCCEHLCTRFCCSACFQSFGYTPRSGIAGSYSDSMFSSLRSCQTVFRSGCTVLHPHQQGRRAPITLAQAHFNSIFPEAPSCVLHLHNNPVWTVEDGGASCAVPWAAFRVRPLTHGGPLPRFLASCHLSRLSFLI